MSVRIREFEDGDTLAWNEFVHHHPHASPFHLIGWKRCIEETFRYRPTYLIAFEGREIEGVLPLFLVQNLIFGRALISTPFAVYGGILASSVMARDRLAEAAEDLGRQRCVQYVEFRNGFPEQCASPSNVDRYATFTRSVTPDETETLASLPKKTRNIVRKTVRSPFVTNIQREDISAFERLHSSTMRRLGTPSFPKKHFERILHHFRGSTDIREIVLNQNVVAASLNFYFRRQMHTYYAASDPAYNAFAPNTYMYFEHLRWAGQNGFTNFEFGRSKKGTGPFEFKRHWGAEIRELPYSVSLVRSTKVPNYSPTNGRFHTAIKLWKTLPLPLTRLLGPQLIRMFP